jgi:hypothetical protein
MNDYVLIKYQDSDSDFKYRRDVNQHDSYEVLPFRICVLDVLYTHRNPQIFLASSYYDSVGRVNNSIR